MIVLWFWVVVGGWLFLLLMWPSLTIWHVWRDRVFFLPFLFCLFCFVVLFGVFSFVCLYSLTHLHSHTHPPLGSWLCCTLKCADMYFDIFMMDMYLYGLEISLVVNDVLCVCVFVCLCVYLSMNVTFVICPKQARAWLKQDLRIVWLFVSVFSDVLIQVGLCRSLWNF